MEDSKEDSRLGRPEYQNVKMGNTIKYSKDKLVLQKKNLGTIH